MSVLRPLNDWSGPPAILTLWRPAARTMRAAHEAPQSPVPPSYEQEQHLRSFRACERQHEEMARLLMVVWEEPGQCDLGKMTDVITAHLRRHDTYHSWFEDRDGSMVRHVFASPADIALEPETLGEVNADGWRRHATAVATPFAWNCFQFGILQRAAGFTCFAAIDHLHGDVSVIPLMMREIHSAYRALVDGSGPLRLPAPLRYLDYCSGQRQRMAAMTLAEPAVAGWIDFLHRNHGRLPRFALPLGVLEDRCLAEYRQIELLDEAGTNAFEAACEAAGARVIGGLMAGAAMTERELAGTDRFGVVTPASTRKSSQAYRTAGWCMGLVPIDLETGARDFRSLAAEAQRIFDDRLPLADVPIERVLELAAGLPTIRLAATGGVMLSYNDMSRPPLTPDIERRWLETDGRTHFNQGMAAQVAMWIFRTKRGLSLTAAYPANATARASMQRYLGTFAAVCRRVAGGREPVRDGAVA